MKREILSRWRRHATYSSWLVTLITIVSLCFCEGIGTSRSNAQDAQPTRVEEDWEIQIGIPDADAVLPEIVTVLTPSSGLTGDYFVLELNHSTLPQFFTGGLQLQRWRNDDVVAYRHGPTVQSIHRDNDVIRFTSVLEIANGQLSMTVLNGTARSWGSFGGPEMKLSTSTSLTDLRGYSPDVSVALSKVSFGTGRVKSFRLLSTRYYADGNLLVEDTQVRRVE